MRHPYFSSFFLALLLLFLFVSVFYFYFYGYKRYVRYVFVCSQHKITHNLSVYSNNNITNIKITPKQHLYIYIYIRKSNVLRKTEWVWWLMVNSEDVTEKRKRKLKTKTNFVIYFNRFVCLLVDYDFQRYLIFVSAATFSLFITFFSITHIHSSILKFFFSLCFLFVMFCFLRIFFFMYLNCM